MTTMLGVAIALGTVICAVIVAAGHSLLSNEARAWLPYVARWLVRSAARRLQEEERDRYEEEWIAELAAWSDRPLSALVKAAHIRWRARDMRASLGSAELFEHPADRAAPVDQVLDGLAKQRHIRDRDALVERFLPLAKELASVYRRSGEPFEDLMQVASLGLIKAIDNFDTNRGIEFSEYAEDSILGEISCYVRDVAWPVHVPRDLQDLSLRVDRAVGELAEKLHRQPSVPEIAVTVGADEKIVVEALLAGDAYHSLSLEEPSGILEDEDDDGKLGDWIGVIDDGFGHVETRLTAVALLSLIGSREREVLRMRFEDDITHAEIAKAIGISDTRVAQIIDLALARMRSAMLE